MSVRKLDLPAIVGRIRAPMRNGAGSSTDAGPPAIEIPDPATLLDLAARAGLTLEWLLYGGGEQKSVSAAPTRSTPGRPPPVNLVLQQPAMVELRKLLSGPMLTQAVREAVAGWTPDATTDAAAEVAGVAAARARAQCLTARDYINATGIIVHTGWGNAPLRAGARERLLDAAGASPTGAAGAHRRTEPCERMLRALTDAERATITTSNAASLLLVGGALAAGREIVVAARDLIEISEGVRVRDIVEASGARVVPVGAANCVNLEDFRGAITPQTALVMRSHASNLAASGYVEHVADVDLARLAQTHNLPFVANLGGGSLVDLTERGLPECPTISHALRDGADLVLASGDKIIGGPQAGIVVGRKGLIETLVRHPLARTCRPGKLTLAALEATLAAYLAGRAWEDIPTLRLLATDLDSLRHRAGALAEGLRQRGYDAVAAEDLAQCGGAVLPGVDLPTWTVRIRHAKFSEEELCALLLARRVVTRRGRGSVIVDLRSVAQEDDPRLYLALGATTAAESV
jgi:L-seryl-tRNA(Ser) seleniumtransferase